MRLDFSTGKACLLTMSDLYWKSKRTVVKNICLFFAVSLLLTSCSALKPLGKPAEQKNSQPVNSQETSPRFIEDISTNSAPKSSKSNTKTTYEEKMPELVDNHTPRYTVNTSFNIEKGSQLQFKYAIIMDVEVEQLSNVDLYKYIESWWGTPYRIGGMTQRGIDCSAFVQSLCASVYGLSLPRVAKEQKQYCSKILKDDDLQEGDLVFFNTRGGVSHVGVYLHNNKFVHASSSEGVVISDLNDPYWARRYLGAGRPGNEAFATGRK
jgi:lipoprotein Spr